MNKLLIIATLFLNLNSHAFWWGKKNDAELEKHQFEKAKTCIYMAQSTAGQFNRHELTKSCFNQFNNNKTHLNPENCLTIANSIEAQPYVSRDLIYASHDEAIVRCFNLNLKSFKDGRECIEYTRRIAGFLVGSLMPIKEAQKNCFNQFNR